MSLHSNAYATYLPAVNAGYAKCVSSTLPVGRRFPQNTDLKDLAFWEPNKLWHYPFALHSVGQYKVGEQPNNGLTNRTKSLSTLIGDSGGFQIGKGTLKGLQYVHRKPMNATSAITAWGREQSARNWIISWLETQCDYAMTIDMPLWAMSNKGKDSPFHNCSPQQLIQATVTNLQEIEAHGRPESKWLNVVQGTSDFSETIAWWDAIKWFRRGGWAMAGHAGVNGGLFAMLAVLLMMRDDGAFEKGQDWVHVLGVSTPFWSIALTEIQKCLRETNPNLIVSFDSSSPFQLGGRYERVCLAPCYTKKKESWVLSTESAPQRPSYASSSNATPFPHPQSPLGSRLLLNELNVRGGVWVARNFDSISNVLLINHNIWIYLDAFMRANDLASARNKYAIPSDYIDALDAIVEIFRSTDWAKKLRKYSQLFENVAPPAR